ncbi:MAG: hypothetical protein QXF44_02235 [Candidatus Bathyarchaeia archaeon]
MKIERTELVAYILIGIGAVLLILTFVMAFMLLTSKLNISSGGNLSEAIGDILGPIAEALIKIMYLGIMGWVGSIATIRGIQLVKEAKQSAAQQPKAQTVQPPPPPSEEEGKK